MRRAIVGLGILVLIGAPAASADSRCGGGARADRILVKKAKRMLYLFHGKCLLKSYRIALGWEPKGHKRHEGDGRTPEGFYRISGKNPKSSYHLSLRISYPSPKDRRRAKERGVSPGGDIMIHGLPPGLSTMGRLHRSLDWTAGCIAVTNKEIEEIWKLVDIGTPIEIRP